MPVYPALRLLHLTLGFLSRPISASVKRKALASPWFASAVCIPSAKLYNRLEHRLKAFEHHHSNGEEFPEHPDTITDDEAVKKGSDLVGDAAVFVLLCLTIIVEWSRKNTRKNRRLLDEEMRACGQDDKIISLGLQLEEERARNRELTRLLYYRESGGANLKICDIKVKSSPWSQPPEKRKVRRSSDGKVVPQS